MESKYQRQGLSVISIHTPEFDWERERGAVEATARRFKLRQPIYLDNDMAFWNGLGNTYWPAFYLVDKHGRVRLGEVGEMHDGADNASRFEQELQRLLAET